MRLAYIYQEETNIKKANVYQADSMVKAFGSLAKVDWYRGATNVTQGKAYYGVSPVSVLNLGLGRAEKWSRLLFCLTVLFRLFSIRPDFVFTRDFAFIYFYSKLPSWLKIKAPLIFESHKVYHRVSEKVSLVQEMSAYSVVDRFVAVSSGIKEDLQKDFGIREEEILVCPNGIEQWKSTSIEGAQEELINFIYAGSHGPWKGVDVILEASWLLEDFKGHIYIVGAHEEELPSYNKALVTVLPPVGREELYTLYNKMDVGILPTLDKREGTRYTSPIKFFEYAYAGLTILSSDIPSIRELAERGFEVTFFKVGSAEELSLKLSALTKEALPETGGNSQLVQEYTWDNRAKRILEWIEN